jgi:hypothetical protein
MDKQARMPGSNGILRIVVLVAFPAIIPLFFLIVASVDGSNDVFGSGLYSDVTPTPKKKPNRHGKKPMNNSNAPSTGTILQDGTWGGTGIIMTVEKGSVHIEYDCASGEIPQALTLNENGEFKADGFHIGRRPGPTREDDPPKRIPATYIGKISGNIMTLKVTLTGDGSEIGEFSLERGKNVRLHKCY